MLTHPEMDDLYELYVLELLEPELASEIDRHLAEGCGYCGEQVKAALALTAVLASTAPRVGPPAALRDRVLRTLAPERRIAMMPPPAGAPPRSREIWGLLSAACAALLVGCIWLGYQNGDLRKRLDSVQTERKQLELALKTISRSETRTVQFGRANQPHGRVFVNAGSGVVFIASSLPKIPNDRTFQLWLIPPTGAPKSAGLFRSDVNDESLRVSTDTVEPGTKAVAVSVEPQAGSTAPTTTPIIVVPLAE